MSGETDSQLRVSMSSHGALSTDFARSYQVIGAVKNDGWLAMRASFTPGALGILKVYSFLFYIQILLYKNGISLVISHYKYRSTVLILLVH